MASDYAKMFQACDSYNQQIKTRLWLHRHGGKGHLGEDESTAPLPLLAFCEPHLMLVVIL